ncbi:MAG: exodeoxyribonuclease VII small subunit [Methanobrevibacter sp.]|nr:exodeoxyribonuclease VII small subunit [Methanobrevibacter sp.]
MENYEEERDVISFEENKSEEKEISFEESLEELENIVNRLESGDVPLDDAISEFNRAMILVKACDDKLKNAEKAIAKIVRENDDVVDFDTE